MDESQRNHLLTIYHTALKAVNGRRCVSNALQHHALTDIVHLIAIGKAATAMYLGAHDLLSERIANALVITKHGYTDAEVVAKGAHLIEAGHPTPDQRSIDAGKTVLEFICATPADAQLLFLISGGASSLVEVLPDGVTLADLQRVNRWLLASGLDIHAMNHVRKSLSLIKGGRLARELGNRTAVALLISDVPGDDLATIGSGLLAPERFIETEVPIELPEWITTLMSRGAPAPLCDDEIFKNISLEIIATLTDAKHAAAECGRELGYEVYEHAATLSGDTVLIGRQLATELLNAPAGLHIWGGETTMQLPEQTGRGGRNQHLALVAATALAGCDHVLLLAAASDGSDGPTDDAGGLVNGKTVARGTAAGLDVNDSLIHADAGTFLEVAGDLIRTEATGTNVMDLMLGLKW
jgi:hydroxypyruvate reductase